MSVDASNFYQNLVAAFGEANAAVVGPTKIIESVYVDYKPEEAALGQTINVPLPARLTSQVADIGTGSFTPINPSSTVVALPFTNHPGISFVVSDFSQYNTPTDIRKMFLDSCLKGILEYINQDLGSLFNSTNFNVYGSPIAGSSNEFTTANMVTAFGKLASARIPVRDFGNFFGLFHPLVFANMTNDTTWSANSQIGYQIAGETRRYGMLGEQWGALLDFDPDMPNVTSGSPATTTYTSAIFHRHAVALGIRPLPIPDTPNVLANNIMLKDIVPVRVMVGYQQQYGGWMITVDAGYARSVIRPDHGILGTVSF